MKNDRDTKIPPTEFLKVLYIVIIKAKRSQKSMRNICSYWWKKSIFMRDFCP